MKGKDALAQGGKKLLGALEKYKFVLLVLLAGVVLLLLPSTGERQKKTPEVSSQELSFDLDALERKMAGTLSQVEGAGKVTVVLTVRAGPRQVLAQDSTSSQKQGESQESHSTVVVSSGSGREEAVALQQVYPVYQGALVVCPGGGDPAVQLKLIEAVSALTGLGADKISVCKGN